MHRITPLDAFSFGAADEVPHWDRRSTIGQRHETCEISASLANVICKQKARCESACTRSLFHTWRMRFCSSWCKIYHLQPCATCLARSSTKLLARLLLREWHSPAPSGRTTWLFCTQCGRASYLRGQASSHFRRLAYYTCTSSWYLLSSSAFSPACSNAPGSLCSSLYYCQVRHRFCSVQLISVCHSQMWWTTGQYFLKHELWTLRCPKLWHLKMTAWWTKRCVPWDKDAPCWSIVQPPCSIVSPLHLSARKAFWTCTNTSSIHPFLGRKSHNSTGMPCGTILSSSMNSPNPLASHQQGIYRIAR